MKRIRLNAALSISAFIILALITEACNLSGSTSTPYSELSGIQLQTITPPEPTSFYVSPQGNDSWSGELEAPNHVGTDGPFRTIGRAKRAVRELLNEPQTEDIIVYIRAGTYYLSTSLVFGTQDSGQGNFRVIYRNYPGETPLISGGKEITHWQHYNRTIYTSTVNHTFASLYENEALSVMARYPNRDPDANNPGGHVYMKVAGLYQDGYGGFYFDPATFPVIQNPTGLEVVIWNGGLHGEYHWNAYRGQVSNLSYTQNLLEANIDMLKHVDSNKLGPGTDYYIQNALELLDQPGEFFLDGTTLYYWPYQLPIEQQTIIAPNLESIFYLHGASPNQPVRNIVFEGLELRHVKRDSHQWPQKDSAAAFYMDNAENITILGNRIQNVGGYGVLGMGEYNTIESNLISDIGYTGIQINGWLDYGQNFNQYNAILNNHIHHTGLINPHGTGIWLNLSSHNHVAYNLLHDIPNAAIRISGDISQLPNTGASNNLVEFNEIYRVIQDFQDMGAIYITIAGPNTTLHNNYVHDSSIPFSFGNAFYMDGYARGTSITNNLIENFQHTGNGYLAGVIDAGDEETTINNNILANNNVEMGGVIYPREFYSLGMTTSSTQTLPNDIDIIGNIFYNNEGPLYYFPFGHEQSWFREADNNLFYNNSDFYMVYGIPGVVTLGDWQTLPNKTYDANSLTSNPKFLSPDNGDYRLRFDSPAYALGFEDINFAEIGLRADFPFTSPSSLLARLFITSDVAGSSANLRLSTNQQAQLTITVRTVSGYIADPGSYIQACESSDEAIATVDNTGLISTIHPGIATIVCSATRGRGGVELFAPVYVLVNSTPSMETHYAPTEVPPPYTTPFMGVLSMIDFDVTQGMLKSHLYNDWKIMEENNNKIYCGHSSETGAWISSEFGSVEWSNYQVETRIRITGGITPSADLQIRRSGVGPNTAAYSHKIFSLTNPANQGVSQIYCLAGSCNHFQSAYAPIDQGKWYLLRAEADGDQIRTFLNGQLMLEQTLDFSKYGNVQVLAPSDTTVCVDDIIVRSLDRSATSMALTSTGNIVGRTAVRSGPGTDYLVLGNISSGEEVFIVESNAYRSWIYIRWDVTGLQGWVPANHVAMGSITP